MTKIKVAENGPYLVSGVTTVTRFPDGKVYEVSGNFALCRCGASSNKPFCDGSHKTGEFSGAKEDDRVPDKSDDYQTADITVRDNRGLCAHAGYCTKGIPAVFRIRKEPFVDASAAPAGEIAATIDSCPSGALTYTLTGSEATDGDAVESAIAFVANGPYVVRGGADCEGVDFPAGVPIPNFTLCRCGKSKNKPFCNGAHWNVQFDEDSPKPD